MKKLFTLLFFIPVFSFSQNDTLGIKQAIQTLFDGMRKGDSAMVRSAFHPKATLGSTLKNREGTANYRSESLPEFYKMVGTPHTEVWNELIWDYDIRIDGIMATAWTPYTFYLSDKLSHCGVNSFTLMRTDTTWKIVSIIDTRRKDNCKEK